VKKIVRYRNSDQVFAVFGSIATQLLDSVYSVQSWQFATRPALLNGHAYEFSPDEGKAGVLHWLWCSRRPEKWSLTWSGGGGWIYTRELDQSPDQVAENIVGEVDAGFNRITGIPQRG